MHATSRLGEFLHSGAAGGSPPTTIWSISSSPANVTNDGRPSADSSTRATTRDPAATSACETAAAAGVGWLSPRSTLMPAGQTTLTSVCTRCSSVSAQSPSCARVRGLTVPPML